MGIVNSLSLQCYSMFSNIYCKATSILSPKKTYQKLSILEEDEIFPAGLLSEMEIQRLLNDSQDYNSRSYISLTKV